MNTFTLNIKNTSKSILICFIICLSFLSCQNKATKTIDGMWSIDTIYYKGYDLRGCMYSNIFVFDKNKAELPTGNICWDFEINGEYGEWEVLKEDKYPLAIKIISNNKVFNGTHQIIFYKDEINKLFKIKIISEDLYIVARKGLFDFDANTGLMNELILESQN